MTRTGGGEKLVITLSAGPARVEIDPQHGGRISSLCVEGLELLIGRDRDPLLWGAYPMAPYAGRIRNGVFSFAGRQHSLPLRAPPHAIHGTTFNRPWREEGPGELSIDLGPDWPFAGEARQRFALDPDGLDLELCVLSHEVSFPASLGFHPWFARRLNRGDPLELHFSAREMYSKDESGIATPLRVPPKQPPWDDCFTALDSAPQLHWPGALVLDIQSETDHWVVYDEPTHAICVEPMTGPPDALNIAPRLVTAEEPLCLKTRFAWRLE